MVKTRQMKKGGSSFQVKGRSSRQLKKWADHNQVKKHRAKRGTCLKWSPENMAAAVSEVMNGTMSQRTASKVYGISRCTLHTRVSGETEAGARPGHPTTLDFSR